MSGRIGRALTTLSTLAVAAPLLAAIAHAQISPEARDRVLPATIQIAVAVVDEENGTRTERIVPRGSGTVVSPDGIILTNHHVVALDDLLVQLDREETAAARQGRTRTLTVAANRFVLLFSERDEPPVRRFTAEVVKDDPDLDLAVLVITGGSRGQPVDRDSLDLTYVALGDSDAVQIADPVHLFGYPMIGSGMITYTEGVVSGFEFVDGIDGRGWINSDATVSGGSSGGAAVNDAGELIGVPTLAEALDCRPGDTNGDGVIDEADIGCIPVGGSLAHLRPVNLALPLLIEVDPDTFGGDQPPAEMSFDTLNLTVGDNLRDYEVATDWTPELVTTPSGGAWAFFTARAKLASGFTAYHLFAARFDPATGWAPAQPLAFGETQLAASAVVDADDTVHLVYISQPYATYPEVPISSTLVYATYDPRSGEWSAAVPIAPDPDAGFQRAPSLVRDGGGELVVVWQDQRETSPEARAVSPDNAGIYASRLFNGAWTDPVRLDARDERFVASRPRLAASADRVVAVWSAYRIDDLARPEMIDWASRTNYGDWTVAKGLVFPEGPEEAVGGESLALAALQNGQFSLVFTRSNSAKTGLYETELFDDRSSWGAVIRVAGNATYAFPDLASGADDTVYLVVQVVNAGESDIEARAAARLYLLVQGSERNLTSSQDGDQVRPAVAVDHLNQPWVLYVHRDNAGAPATEVRVIRNAAIDAD